MLSKNVKKDKLSLSTLAEKIKASGILQATFELSLSAEGIKIQFHSPEELVLALSALGQYGMSPLSGSSNQNDYFCIFDQETIQKLLSLIETGKLKKPMPSIKDHHNFVNTSYQLITKSVKQDTNADIPLFLTLSLEVICEIMKYLDYQDALNLACWP
jgi:hypothetical protein